MDFVKHVDYWKVTGQEDMAAAKSLLERGHLRHALFFAHLSLEKLLKAHVTHRTRAVPPRIHSLIRLAELAGLALVSDAADFLRTFGIYQLEGRYPDTTQAPLDADVATRHLVKAEEVLAWLTAQL